MSNSHDNAQTIHSLFLTHAQVLLHPPGENIHLSSIQHNPIDYQEKLFPISYTSQSSQKMNEALLFSRSIEPKKDRTISYKKMKKLFKQRLKNAKNSFMPALHSLAEIYTAIHTTRQFQEETIKLDELSIYQLQESVKSLQSARKYIKDTIAAGHEHFTDITTQKYEQFQLAYDRGIAEYNMTASGKKLDQHLRIYYDSARYFQQYLLKDYKKRRESLPKILYYLNEILKNADINALIDQRLVKASNKGKKRFEKTKTVSYNPARTNKIFSARYRYEVAKVTSEDDDFPHHLARKKGEASDDYYCVKIWLKEIHQVSTRYPLYINYVNVATGSIIISHSWRNLDKTQVERDAETKHYLVNQQDTPVQRSKQDESVSRALNHSKIVRQTLHLVAKSLHHTLPDFTSLTRYMVVNDDTVALVQAICRKAKIAPGQTLKLKQGTPAYFAIFDTPNGKGMPFLLNSGRSILHINITPGDDDVIEEMEFVFGKKTTFVAPVNRSRKH